ncbi:hypothetical protein GCM10023143_08910 [Compostibacter hankyongensis]|uniref:Uncharacterized protein n=1 Tax=Compostibacter hankyongensis TaxID=1007089 RepID=A0ABP8FIA9_9BACT
MQLLCSSDGEYLPHFKQAIKPSAPVDIQQPVFPLPDLVPASAATQPLVRARGKAGPSCFPGK